MGPEGINHEHLRKAYSLWITSASASRLAPRRKCMQLLHCLTILLDTRLQISQQYLACLKENANDAAKCRDISKLYLQCRMDRSAAYTDCC